METVPQRHCRACLALRRSSSSSCSARLRPPADAIIGGPPATPGYFGFVSFVGARSSATGPTSTAPARWRSEAYSPRRIAGTCSRTGAAGVGLRRRDRPGRPHRRDDGPGARSQRRRAVSHLERADAPRGCRPAPARATVATAVPVQRRTTRAGPAGRQLAIVAGWGRTSLTGALSFQLNWLDLSLQDDSYSTPVRAPLRRDVDVLRYQPGTDRQRLQR